MSGTEAWGEKRAESFAKPGMTPVYAAMAKRITADWAHSGAKFTFLDLGTGAGLLPVEVKRLCPQAQVIGVDPSQAMLDLARRNAVSSGLSGIETRVGKAEEIPAEPESVDLLMAQFSLHEWDDLNKGFSEMTRVLRQNGTLVIRAWNKSCPFWKFLRHNVTHMFKYGWKRAKEARISRRRSYPFRVVMDLVCRYGLAPIETEDDVILFIKARKVPRSLSS